jgi:hypothetical protein
LTLPNGLCLLTPLPTHQLLFVSADLADATPRLVSSLMLAHLKDPPTQPHILKSLSSELSKVFNKDLTTDLLKDLPTSQLTAS